MESRLEWRRNCGSTNQDLPMEWGVTMTTIWTVKSLYYTGEKVVNIIADHDSRITQIRWDKAPDPFVCRSACKFGPVVRMFCKTYSKSSKHHTHVSQTIFVVDETVPEIDIANRNRLKRFFLTLKIDRFWRPGEDHVKSLSVASRIALNARNFPHLQTNNSSELDLVLSFVKPVN